MSRDKRRESGTGVYHVVMRGNNKEKIFDKTSDKIQFKNILKKELNEYPVTVFAYCIMTNHIHLMLEAEYKVLPKFMQRVNSTYAEGYNSKYDRCKDATIVIVWKPRNITGAVCVIFITIR